MEIKTARINWGRVFGWKTRVWENKKGAARSLVRGDGGRRDLRENKGIENFANAICWILFAVETKVSFAFTFSEYRSQIGVRKRDDTSL